MGQWQHMSRMLHPYVCNLRRRLTGVGHSIGVKISAVKFERRQATAMPKTILLLSRDPALQASRALVLEAAGYRTIKTSSMTSAVQLSAHCQMSIIGHSFSPVEQNDFIERVHEGNPSVFILCLRFGLTQPNALLKAVGDCFTTQPGGSRICILEESNVIAWPKRAS